MKTKVLPPPLTDLGKPSMARWLDHQHRSRMARIEQRKSGMTVEEIAERAGLRVNTVYRFLGLATRWTEGNSKDPRTSTTMKVFAALGFECQWVKR